MVVPADSAGERRSTGGRADGTRRKRRPGEVQRLGDVLMPALDRLSGSEQARAYAAWSRAAGEQVAAGARPRAFARGVLTVECTSSVWANELTYLSAEILRRMDDVMPAHPVVKLRFMVASAPVKQETESRAEKCDCRHARPAPQDYGEARALAEGVTDERLRAAILAVLGPPGRRSDQTPRDCPPGGSQK